MSTMSMNNRSQAKQQFSLPGISFNILFWTFIVGSVAGFVFEGTWSIIKTGHWEHHAATLWGPFCIIYGAGAVLVYSISYILRKRNTVVQFATYMIAGSLVEFFFSLLQEKWFGSVSWNYSSHFLNIGGRVSLKMTLIWGVIGIIFAKFVFPYLGRLIMKFKGKGANAVTCILVAFMIVNLAATSLAVTRWRMRLNGAEPKNQIEQILDSTYNDTKMERLFTNMNFLEKVSD